MTELNSAIRHIPMPDRIRHLPVSPTGYPVPWFVQWFENDKPGDFGVGVPDFRVIDSRKMERAVREHRCWVCGEPAGKFLAFTIGPMCAINRVISEPPSHLECAIFSTRACPFLSQPRMRRNTKDLPEQGQDAAGFAIDRNPGVICIWVTRSYRPFRVKLGEGVKEGILFRMGDPEQTLWTANGQEATRAEVLASIDSGFPLLERMAEQEGGYALVELEKSKQRVMQLLPAL